MPKMRQKNILNFVKMRFLPSDSSNQILFPFLLGLIFAIITFCIITHFVLFVTDTIIFLALSMTIQGIITLYLMLYAWESAEKIKGNRITRLFSTNRYRITALVPARH